MEIQSYKINAFYESHLFIYLFKKWTVYNNLYEKKKRQGIVIDLIIIKMKWTVLIIEVITT